MYELILVRNRTYVLFVVRNLDIITVVLVILECILGRNHISVLIVTRNMGIETASLIM